MSVAVDSAQPTTPQSAAPARAKMARFVGRAKVFWLLLARGAVLLMLTLGLYRFWLTTDIRRYLWSNTEIADETFEYTGTARELLLGFLIAIAVLVPLYVVFFLLTLAPGEGMWSLLSIAIIAFLGQYAVYRARRYRLTRTIYRGVRFHQTGSALRYSVCAVLWWGLTVLTLGLAYPFGQAQLERFKMRHTFFGSLSGRFEGSGWRLFARGILLWALAIVPFLIGAVASILAIDWNAVASATAGEASWLESSGLGGAVVFAALSGVWLLLSLALLYPIFQAIMLRWWVSGLRFGEVGVSCRLRTGEVFAVYARFVGYVSLFSLLATVFIGMGGVAVAKLTGSLDSLQDEIVTTVLGLGAYVAVALGYSAIYQGTVKIGLWRCIIESLDVSNVGALEKVAAAGEAASPIGEGLADALNVGGI
jgi:uncharacterized membrane protein YjgN (DUF898 family)